MLRVMNRLIFEVRVFAASLLVFIALVTAFYLTISPSRPGLLALNFLIPSLFIGPLISFIYAPRRRSPRVRILTGVTLFVLEVTALGVSPSIVNALINYGPGP